MARAKSALRFAYADPPYIGQAKRLYGCEEIDHPALVRRLIHEFPDGWALSCGSKDLRFLLPLCPEDVRVAAWCKTWTPLVLPVKYAWEPVIWRGGRKGKFGDVRARDWLTCAPRMNTGVRPDAQNGKRRTRNGREKNFAGAKPDEFFLGVGVPDAGRGARGRDARHVPRNGRSESCMAGVHPAGCAVEGGAMRPKSAIEECIDTVAVHILNGQRTDTVVAAARAEFRALMAAAVCLGGFVGPDVDFEIRRLRRLHLLPTPKVRR